MYLKIIIKQKHFKLLSRKEHSEYLNSLKYKGKFIHPFIYCQRKQLQWLSSKYGVFTSLSEETEFFDSTNAFVSKFDRGLFVNGVAKK
jgi:hypothetical protein